MSLVLVEVERSIRNVMDKLLLHHKKAPEFRGLFLLNTQFHILSIHRNKEFGIVICTLYAVFKKFHCF